MNQAPTQDESNSFNWKKRCDRNYSSFASLIPFLQERFGPYLFVFDPYLFMIYNFWKPIDQTNNKCGLDKSSPYKKYKVPFI